jgi:hypothetical protein
LVSVKGNAARDESWQVAGRAVAFSRREEHLTLVMRMMLISRWYDFLYRKRKFCKMRHPMF